MILKLISSNDNTIRYYKCPNNQYNKVYLEKHQNKHLRVFLTRNVYLQKVLYSDDCYYKVNIDTYKLEYIKSLENRIKITLN